MNGYDPNVTYSVAIDTFDLDPDARATHALVPLEQWRDITAIAQAAECVFDLTDTETAFDSRLKSLRKAVERHGR